MRRRNNLERSDLELIQRLTRKTLHFAAASPEAQAVAGEIILALNRLAGSPVVATEIGQMITRILPLLMDSPLHKVYVAEMVEGLNELAMIRSIAASPRASSPTLVAAESARRRPDFQSRYEVRRRGEEEVLVEIRRGSGKDSSISRADYDAAISAMSLAGEAGHHFDDLLANFINAGGGKQTYRLRVILRFWRLGGPPLITRRSTRYATLVPPQRFAVAADAFWQRQRYDCPECHV